MKWSVYTLKIPCASSSIVIITSLWCSQGNFFFVHRKIYHLGCEICLNEWKCVCYYWCKYMSGIDESFKSRTKIYFTRQEHKNQITFLMLLLSSHSHAVRLSTSFRTRKLISWKSSINMFHDVTKLRKESNSWAWRAYVDEWPQCSSP